MIYPSDLSDEQVRKHLERIKSDVEAGQWDRWLRIANEIDADISGNTVLDRLAAKLQTYRARSLNASQRSLLDALADDIEEEREKIRGAKVATEPDHLDAGPGFTHHDHSACCPCPCRSRAS